MNHSSSSTRALLIAALLSLSTVCTAQRGNGNGNGNGNGGGGNGGGGEEPAAIHRPVIVGYPWWSGGGSSPRYDPDPAWMALIDSQYDYFHPDQLEPDGAQRELLAAVSARGDLTHGGGARFVLDVRMAAGGGTALIATPETPGTPENPTWFYDGPGGDDDTADRVLVSDAEFVVTRARWSRNGARIAMEATEVASGTAGIWVGDIVTDGLGVPDDLANIVLVARGGSFPAWGGDRVAFTRGSAWNPGFLSGPGDGYVVDVSLPTTPVEVALGALTSPPALSSDGSLVVYSRDLGTRWDLFVRDLGTGIETRVTDAGRVSESFPGYPAFSPDDTELVFSIEHACFSSVGCRSLATIDLLGTGNRSVISDTFTVTVGKGKNGRRTEVGSLATAIWRN